MVKFGFHYLPPWDVVFSSIDSFRPPAVFFFRTTALLVHTDLEDTRVSNESPPWSKNTPGLFFSNQKGEGSFGFKKKHIYEAGKCVFNEMFSLRIYCGVK